MKNQIKLGESYQTQKKLFEDSKTRKYLNLIRKRDDVTEKIRKLREVLAQTEKQIEENLDSSFISFEDYSFRSKTQSEQSKVEKTLLSSDDSNPSNEK